MAVLLVVETQTGIDRLRLEQGASRLRECLTAVPDVKHETQEMTT